MLRETLTKLEAELPALLFWRTSRSVIVNVNRFSSIESSPRNDYIVVLDAGRRLLPTPGLRQVQEKLQYPQ